MLRGLFALLSMTSIPRLIVRLTLDRRVPFRLKLLIPAAILYVLSPIDLVPDFFLQPLLLFGRLDDVLALVAAGALFLLLAPRDVLMEAAGHPQADGESRRRAEGATVIEGESRRLDE